MNIEKLIESLNEIGYGIADKREEGLGFVVRKSPYQDLGASLNYSNMREFHITVSSRERSIDETLQLGNALINLSEIGRMLNEAEK